MDHVATVRQARYARMPHAVTAEPSLEEAIRVCEAAGAHGITMHLRGDRRHVQDADIRMARSIITTKLNFELGNHPDIVALAHEVKPEEVCLVPEVREEITTEGGLDVVSQQETLRPVVGRFLDAGIAVSLFVDPELGQIEAAKMLDAPIVELHTGAFANAASEEQKEKELRRLIEASELAHSLGIQVNAGHGINYENIYDVLRIPHLAELNIGHAIVSRAIFTGLGQAVRDMNRCLLGERI